MAVDQAKDTFKSVSLSDESLDEITKNLVKVFDFAQWNITDEGIQSELIFRIQHRGKTYIKAMPLLSYEDTSNKSLKQDLIDRFSETIAMDLAACIIKDKR